MIKLKQLKKFKNYFFYRKFHYYVIIVNERMLTIYDFEEDDCMKKIILSAVAITMLLSNVAFASTRTSNANSAKIKAVSTVEQSNVIHLDTYDPH